MIFLLIDVVMFTENIYLKLPQLNALLLPKFDVGLRQKQKNHATICK